MKRTLQVDFQTAKDWYNGTNKTLKELALRLFSEDELTFSYNSLMKTVETDTLIVNSEYKSKLTVLHKLSVLASYFNFKHTSINRKKYFITGKDRDQITTGSHETVKYPGVVYFNREADIHTALLEFSQEELKILFS